MRPVWSSNEIRIHVHNPSSPFCSMLPGLRYCLMGIVSGTKAVAGLGKALVEYWLRFHPRNC